MIPIQGADYATASGERRYKGTDPATVVHEADMNQILLALHRLVTASGQALLADGAADLADNWMQVVRAVNRLSRQAPETAVVMVSSSVNLGLTADTFNFRIEADGGGDEVDGQVSVETDADHVGRVIIIRNSTPSRKFVNTNSGGSAPDPVTLNPQQAIAFYATVGGISGCQWIALRPATTTDLEEGDKLFFTNGRVDARLAAVAAVLETSGSFACEIRDTGGSNLIGTSTMYWKKHGSIVTLAMGTATGTLSATPGAVLFISAASNANFPAGIQNASGITGKSLLKLSVDSVFSVGDIYFSTSEQRLRIGKLDQTDFTGSVSYALQNFVHQYHL